MYNNKQKGNYRQNYNNNRNKQINFDEITIPLAKEYGNVSEVYLPNGKAYTIAEKLKNVPNHQIRKVLEQAKEAKRIIEYSQDDDALESAKKQLFMIVTMSAYNSGRMPAIKNLYDYLRNTISQKTIVSKEDILVFDEVFTSIVAFHATLSNKR